MSFEPLGVIPAGAERRAGIQKTTKPLDACPFTGSRVRCAARDDMLRFSAPLISELLNTQGNDG
jgi:hypothetical protein